MRDDPPPRFVPILTEVVQAPAAAPAPVTDDGPTTAPAPAGLESALRVDDEWVGQLTARVLAELEPLVIDAVRTLQAQQARDLQVMVRAMVADRLAQLVADIQVVSPPQ
jgi:hypothetical protein